VLLPSSIMHVGTYGVRLVPPPRRRKVLKILLAIDRLAVAVLYPSSSEEDEGGLDGKGSSSCSCCLGEGSCCGIGDGVDSL
jgi:hypothetical protein